jgi:hypothetical protein
MRGLRAGGSIMSDLFALLIVIGPVTTMLLWLNHDERRARRADVVLADMRAAANRALGGESFLAISVDPAERWRAGRVHLSVPGGYEWLIQSVWHDVVTRMPAGYELVVHRPFARA